LLHATTAELIEDVENPICQICMGTRMDENGTHVSYVPSLRGSGSGAGPGVTLVHGEAMTQDLDLKRLYTRIFSDLPWPAPLPRPEEVRFCWKPSDSSVCLDDRQRALLPGGQPGAMSERPDAESPASSGPTRRL
jgi:hypothetical protein